MFRILFDRWEASHQTHIPCLLRYFSKQLRFENEIPSAHWESLVTLDRAFEYPRKRYTRSCVLAIREKTSSSGTTDGNGKSTS